jgi:hypothetical protein
MVKRFGHYATYKIIGNRVSMSQYHGTGFMNWYTRQQLMHQYSFFQYKILYTIQQSDSCRLCHEVESVEHLFWYCPSGAYFRSQVQEWLLCHNIRVRLDLETLLLGDLKDHSQSIGNIIAALGKMFIFRSILAEMLQMERFKSRVWRHGRMERCIAWGNVTMMIYWEIWIDLWLSEG